ncbi:LPS translocon maturation chaperone LptM [Shewanella donghaensis]|uniref:LPS translocon maturation chaperone LptM n=1 Tax=Shewanella donghaensis TaxID=238836 RepID=UPI0014577F06
MRLFLLVMLASLFIIGCGQKGALYKTPDTETNQEERKPQESAVEENQENPQPSSQQLPQELG